MKLKGKRLDGEYIEFELCDVGPFYVDDDVVYCNSTPVIYSSIVAIEKHKQSKKTKKK